MGAAIVPMRSFQAQNVYAFKSYQPAVQVIATFGRFIIIPNIMVAPDIIKGHIKKVNQPGKVLRGKISAGKNEVNVLKNIGIDPPVQPRLDDIRDG